MRRWLIILIILLALAAAGYFYLQSQGGIESFTGGEPAAEEVATPIPVVEANNEIVAEAVVVPVNFAALSMSTGGIVAEVLVSEGDVVEEGQLIARIDNERQVIAIAQAEARVASVQARLDEQMAGPREEEIASAEASVDAAKANLAQLTEGARPEDIASAEAALFASQASLSQVLSGADDAQIINAKATLKNAEAERTRAQNAYNRVKWRNDVGATQEAAALQQATNNYEAAKATLDDLEAGADQSDIASAQAGVTQARASLDKANAPGSENEVAASAANVRSAEAQLELVKAGARPEAIAGTKADLMEAQTTLMQAHVDLDNTELHAPFGGTIASLDLKVGEQVAAGTPVMQLADISTWLIETDDLTEIGVVNVREGDSVSITFDAIDDLEVSGTVVRIKPLGENKQGDITYTATIVPDETDERLRWNMTAAVTIMAGQ